MLGRGKQEPFAVRDAVSESACGLGMRGLLVAVVERQSELARVTTRPIDAAGQVPACPRAEDMAARGSPPPDAWLRSFVMVDDPKRLIEHYRRELGRVLEGRRVVVIGGPVARLTDIAGQLRELGAEPLIIGSSVGTGQLPTDNSLEWCSLEVRAANLNDAFRTYENLLNKLPDEARQKLDAWDPERRAIAVGTIVLNDVPSVGGRPRYGARPRSWAALEDKTVIDTFWDSIGVPRPPSAVVHPDQSALRAAVDQLDAGRGTVWVADARDGVHRGGDFSRWVRSPSDFDEALRFFAPRSDRVRVTPFLDGVPCSIHGMVLPDGIAVFRPVELMTLRRPGSSRFVYAGAATYWDPDPADRERLRELGRIVGEGLAERVGFRGAFTVDGVLTLQGFAATELNPRIGAGLAVLERSIPGLPLLLLAIAAQAGESLDYRTEALEELVVTAADARRAGAGSVVIPGLRPKTAALAVVRDGTAYRPAGDRDVPDAELLVGPSDLGGFVRFTPDPARYPKGPALAPQVAAAFELAQTYFDVPVGGLIAPE